MKVKFTTPASLVDAYFSKAAKIIDELIIRRLAYLGEECIIEARDRSAEESWTDRSGNLRSSIGYTITANGKIVMLAGFKQTAQGSEGVKTGRALAEELARRYSSGYTLIIVAGMNYAEYVEAMDNKVVLASTELFARRKLPEMLEKLRSQIAKIKL